MNQIFDRGQFCPVLYVTSLLYSSPRNKTARKAIPWRYQKPKGATKMQISSAIRTIGLVTAVAACSDGLGPVIERNDGGTGTTTLQINANIDANAVAGGMVTEFWVRVRDGLGEAVSGATVAIQNDDLGVVTLLEGEVGSGVYVAELNAFSNKNFELSVVNGEDRVEGVVAGSPGLHAILTPVLADTVTAGEALLVTWDVPSAARGAEVSTRDYESGVLPDNGEFLIPTTENVARLEQRVRVARFNEVDIVGGLTGSRLRIEVTRDVEPLLVRGTEPQG